MAPVAECPPQPIVLNYFDDRLRTKSNEIFKLDNFNMSAYVQSSPIIKIITSRTSYSSIEEIEIENNFIPCEITNSLNSFNDLPENWDGYGSVKPNSELIEISKVFLDLLKNNSYDVSIAYPLGDGSIQLDFSQSESEFEIEIGVESAKLLKFDMEDNLIETKTFSYETPEQIFGNL